MWLQVSQELKTVDAKQLGPVLTDIQTDIGGTSYISLEHYTDYGMCLCGVTNGCPVGKKIKGEEQLLIK